jgi:hypothetical protein
MTVHVARSHSVSVPVAAASRIQSVPVERRVPSAIKNRRATTSRSGRFAPNRSKLLRVGPCCKQRIVSNCSRPFRVAPNRPGLLRGVSKLLVIVPNRFDLLPIRSSYLHRFRCSESSRTTPNRLELLRMFKIVPSWPWRLICLCVPLDHRGRRAVGAASRHLAPSCCEKST